MKNTEIFYHSKFVNENLNGIENLEFYKTIDAYNRILRFELRYSSISTTRNDRKAQRNLPISSAKRKRSVILTSALILFIVYSMGETLILLSIDAGLPDELKLVRVAISSSMSVILLLSYLFSFKIKRKLY